MHYAYRMFNATAINWNTEKRVKIRCTLSVSKEEGRVTF